MAVRVPPSGRRSPELVAGQVVRAPLILACAAGMWRARRLAVTGEGVAGEPEALEDAWVRLWSAGGAALPDAAGGLRIRRPPLADWEGLVGGATILWLALHDAVGGDLLAPPVEGTMLVAVCDLQARIGGGEHQRLAVDLHWSCTAAWRFIQRSGGSVRVRAALAAHPRSGVQVLGIGFAEPADLRTVAALANSAAQALLAARLWEPVAVPPAPAAAAGAGQPLPPPPPPGAAPRDRGRKRDRE